VIDSRKKGQVGEREVAQILRDELGLEIRRNWAEQSHHGGVDLVGIPGWALEVKRARVARLNDWWIQTTVQAAQAKARPALIYRLDRQDWKVMVSLYDVQPILEDHCPITMGLFSWVGLVREELEPDADYVGDVSAAQS